MRIPIRNPAMFEFAQLPKQTPLWNAFFHHEETVESYTEKLIVIVLDNTKRILKLFPLSCHEYHIHSFSYIILQLHRLAM